MNNVKELIDSLASQRAQQVSGYAFPPKISDNIVANAANKIALGIDPAAILAIFNIPWYGKGDEGIVFAETALYLKEAQSRNITIPLNGIENVDFSGRSLAVMYVSGEKITVNNGEFSKELEFISELLDRLKVPAEEIGKTDRSSSPEPARADRVENGVQAPLASPAGGTTEIDSEAYIKKVIAERIKSTESSSYYMSPDIPSKMMINAADKVAQGVDPATIVAIFDNSIMGNGKEGIVFTGTKLYLKEAFCPHIVLPLLDISQVDYNEETKTSENGKEKTTKTLIVSYSSGETITIKNTDYSKELDFIYTLLDGMKGAVVEIGEKKQNMSLSELSEDVTIAYINIATAYLKADDRIIDAAEYKELMSLMARIKVSKSTAAKLREDRFSEETGKIDFPKLVEELRQKLYNENVDTQSIFQSLFKDLIMLRKENLDNWRSDAAICELKPLLDITDEQAETLITSIKTDIRIIDERLEDNQIKEIAKELSALAGGAGVTLAALAVTGGVSSGICGGLLTLGTMSTGGMLLGLAAIGGLGYGAYRGVKYFSGTSELEKSGIRIAALQSAMECSKAAVTYIVDDINQLTRQLTEITEKVKESDMLNDELIQQLIDLQCDFSTVSDAGSKCEEDIIKSEYEVNLASLPMNLAYGRFEELVKHSPNRTAIKEYILSIYKETTVSEKDSEGKEVTKTIYKRDEELSYDDAKQIHNYLDLIGYYDTKSSAVAQAKSGISSIKSFFKG